MLFFRSSRDTQFAQLLTHVIVDCCCKGTESCIWTRNTWSAHQTEHPTSHQGNSVRQVQLICPSMSSQFIGPCRWPFRRQVQYPQLPAGGLLLPFGRGFIGCETMPPLYTNIAIWRQHDSFHAAGVSRNRCVAYTVLHFATFVWSLSTLHRVHGPHTLHDTVSPSPPECSGSAGPWLAVATDL